MGPTGRGAGQQVFGKGKTSVKKYFDTLAKKVSDADELAIFGPAETPDKFTDALKSRHSALAGKIKLTETADSMTENQFKALVKRSFGMDDRYPEGD